nr:alpha/beta hydrolase [Catellatospora tritici]
MPLHPQVQAMRAGREASRTPQLYTLSVEQARAADLASIQAAGGTPEHVAEVFDRDIDGPGGPLPIRIYRPVLDQTLPVLVYYFGGGWTLGTIDTADAVCRTLANAAGCLVVAAGYRLAPEHRFPAAVHDCHAAAAWVAAHAAELGADPGRVAVGGDSAGGNLAAAVALLARDQGPELAGQLLVYPNTDYTSNTPSLREGTDPYLFNATSVAWYWENYLATPADGRDPLASPLLAADHTGLPPALVITAEYDPLRDQAEQYAAKLSESGVPVTLARYDGMIHGFFCMAGDLADGRRAQEQAAAQLRTWFTR